MLTVWDVVEEQNENRYSRRQMDKICEKFSICQDKRVLKKQKKQIGYEEDLFIMGSALQTINHELTTNYVKSDFAVTDKSVLKLVNRVYDGLTQFCARHGCIEGEFECINGWNRIVAERDISNSAYYQPGCFLEFFLVGNTFWLFIGNGNKYELCLYVMSLIVMYVIGRHNEDFKPEYLGIYSMYDYTESKVCVQDICNRTLDYVARKYIGYDYSNSNTEWFNAVGENLERISELSIHFDATSEDRCIWPFSEQERIQAKRIYEYYTELLHQRKDKIHSYIDEVNISSPEECDILMNNNTLPAGLEIFVHEKSISEAPLIGKVAIYYISDVHLEWHVDSSSDKEAINAIARGIIPSDLKSRIKKGNNDFIVAFCGDIADTLELSKWFYEGVVSYWRSLSQENAIDQQLPIFVVLGNHECSEFDTVKQANMAYKEMLDG